MSTMTFSDSASPDTPFLGDGATDDTQERDAEVPPQRWPLSSEVRSALVESALELAGLKSSASGTAVPLEAKPKLTPRIRLAAMRLIASFDRLSIQERKLDLLENPSGEKPKPPYVETREVSSEVATECQSLLAESDAILRAQRAAGIPVIPWKRTTDRELASELLRQRWPISKAIRSQIIVEVLSLCGFAVTPLGKVESTTLTDDMPRPSPRTVLAAMRILAAFDRLSLEERWVELRFKRAESPDDDFYPNVVPEIAVRIHELIENDNRRIKDERRRGILPRDIPPDI